MTNAESYLSSVSYIVTQVVHSLKTPSAVPDKLLYKQTMETSALATEKKDPSHCICKVSPALFTLFNQILL